MPALPSSARSGWHSHVLVTVEGFVLAGGNSRRFGQDKALVVYQGSTLVERSVQTLLEAECERVVVLHRRPDALRFLDCEIAFDLGGGRGPLDGLHTALSLARSELVVTLPVDQPLVTAEVVRRLLEVATDETEHDVVAACDDQDSRHHLTAVWRREECLAIVGDHVARGESSPRRMLSDLRDRWVRFPAAIMLNVNRPEELPTPSSTLADENRSYDADRNS